MSKTQSELKHLKTEFETLKARLKELNENELKVVIGGSDATSELEDLVLIFDPNKSYAAEKPSYAEARGKK